MIFETLGLIEDQARMDRDGKDFPQTWQRAVGEGFLFITLPSFLLNGILSTRNSLISKLDAD